MIDTRIIGIAGTNGSGKDSVGHTLADRHSYLFVSVTDLLRAELNRRGVSVDRENLRNLSAEWRREYGYAVLIDRAIQEFNRLKGQYVGIAIASLRNPAEADRIHELGGAVIWIDADPKIRYERIQNNAEARARAGEDSKSFEEFLAEEEAEMHSSGDAATLDMSAVRKKADILLNNNQTNLEDFQDFISEQLFGMSKDDTSTPTPTEPLGEVPIPTEPPVQATTPPPSTPTTPQAQTPTPPAQTPPTQPPAAA